MTSFLTAGSADGERDHLAGALLAFAQAPSDPAEAALRRSAPGHEEELVALGEALHAFPGSEWHRVLRGRSRAAARPAGLPGAAGRATGTVLRDVLADPAGTAAFSAYLDRPAQAERAALVDVAAAGDGPWLVAFADALRRYPRSDWADTVAAARAGSDVAAGPSTPPVAPVVRLPVVRLPAGRTRRPALRRAVAAAVVVVVVVLAGVLAGVVATRGTTSPPAGVPTLAASWRLAGEIAPAWQATSRAQSSVSAIVACPDARVCYASDPVPDTSGDAVEASTDGGASWRTVPLPSGFQLTSPLACPAAGVCFGAGHSTQATGARTAAMVKTDSGGTSWTVEPLPTGVDRVLNLACPTATDCVGVGFATAPAGSASREGPSIAVATTDGGATWAETALPQPFFPVTPDGTACTSAQDCVLVGTTTLNDTPPPNAADGAALVTVDGGTTWSRGEVPADVGTFRAVSCAPGGHCLALANRAGPVATSGTPADWPSVALTTTTGRSWVAATGTGLTLGGATSVSCPTTNDCWVLGWRAGTPAGHLMPETQTTDDGGDSWTTVPLPVKLTARAQATLGVPRLIFELPGSISCPTATTCVALDVVATTTSTLDRQIVLRENSVGPTK